MLMGPANSGGALPGDLRPLGRMVPDRYEPVRYWESTLGGQFDARGTGFPNLPHSFNLLLYAQMRRAVEHLVDDCSLRDTLATAAVLDVGSGAGFWIEFWKALGARDITGVDLTETATGTLRERHPELSFRQLDIGGDRVDLGRRFDVISIIGVLQHITDDQRFRRALSNLATLLDDQGRIFVMDPVVVHAWWGDPVDERSISRARPLELWQQVLAAEGLEITRMVPVTYLFASPGDTRHALTFRLLEDYWKVLSRALKPDRDRLGRLVGWPLLAADRALVRRTAHGPSTKAFLVERIDRLSRAERAGGTPPPA
jgi:2-polyprenyl-3-methyl-5-hydroxy-6-metoxy-1,4-benzoquinol methylase